MARRNATENVAADVDALLDDLPEPVKELEAQPERKTKKYPHEENRKDRMVSLTFPSAAWKQFVLSKAEEWGGLGISDLLVFCVAHTMAEIESGKLDPPDGSDKRFHHRAGEFLDLPWEPKR